jgi:hypothetical protein
MAHQTKPVLRQRLSAWANGRKRKQRSVSIEHEHRAQRYRTALRPGPQHGLIRLQWRRPPQMAAVHPQEIETPCIPSPSHRPNEHPSIRVPKQTL